MATRWRPFGPIAAGTLVYTLSACGGSPSEEAQVGTAGSDSAEAAAPAADMQYGEYIMPPSSGLVALKKCKAVSDKREDSFDIPAGKDSLLVFSRESTDPARRDHAIWVWSRAAPVRVTMKEVEGYPLLLDVTVEPNGAIAPDERWAILIFDAQGCDEDLPLASEVLAIGSTGAKFLPTSVHLKKKQAVAVLEGNSTYVLGAPGR